LIALLALFVALGGTAIAAKRYVITSTSQIKPSILTKIEGADRSEIVVVRQVPFPIYPGQAGRSIATCPNGGRVISGGASATSLNGVATSEPSEDRTSWIAVAANSNEQTTAHVQAIALCALRGYAAAAGITQPDPRTVRQANARVGQLDASLRTHRK
jgi:hypothetical protein